MSSSMRCCLSASSFLPSSAAFSQLSATRRSCTRSVCVLSTSSEAFSSCCRKAAVAASAASSSRKACSISRSRRSSSVVKSASVVSDPELAGAGGLAPVSLPSPVLPASSALLALLASSLVASVALPASPALPTSGLTCSGSTGAGRRGGSGGPARAPLDGNGHVVGRSRGESMKETMRPDEPQLGVRSEVRGRMDVAAAEAGLRSEGLCFAEAA
mmetsp:Transcript_14637/g.42667  ORF Transcript_14637/g.42667 Transcript_14637/m.42667 type:complete len:215 (+) Transcript_14637:403-1047(+)